MEHQIYSWIFYSFTVSWTLEVEKAPKIMISSFPIFLFYSAPKQLGQTLEFETKATHNLVYLSVNWCRIGIINCHAINLMINECWTLDNLKSINLVASGNLECCPRLLQQPFYSDVLIDGLAEGSVSCMQFMSMYLSSGRRYMLRCRNVIIGYCNLFSFNYWCEIEIVIRYHHSARSFHQSSEFAFSEKEKRNAKLKFWNVEYRYRYRY